MDEEIEFLCAECGEYFEAPEAAVSACPHCGGEGEPTGD